MIDMIHLKSLHKELNRVGSIIYIPVAGCCIFKCSGENDSRRAMNYLAFLSMMVLNFYGMRNEQQLLFGVFRNIIKINTDEASRKAMCIVFVWVVEENFNSSRLDPDFYAFLYSRFFVLQAITIIACNTQSKI